ncbi:MAG TPA: hypothetical protein VHE35_25385 [Kofleriaceae bacterium]|nr:hypothetical protein [Kofleriaceae bacterium]
MKDHRPLAVSELAQLLVRMEQAIAETARGFAFGMAAVAGLFVAMALGYGIAFHAWGIAAFIGAFAAGIVWIGRVARRKTSPERMQPVMDAVRDAPGSVATIRHYTTSDSRRMFVTHWLEVKTDTHRLVMKAQQDWQQLLDYLTRRCPGADVTDR